MQDELSRAVERANERIEVLEAFADDFNADTPRPDRDAKVAKPAHYLLHGAGGVHTAVDEAVQAVLGVLAAAAPSVESGIRKRPPNWWHHTVTALRDDTLEGARSMRMLGTLMTFEPHLDADASPDLVPFILLASDDQRELVIERVPTGFRSVGQPNSQRTVIAYNPHIDDDIRRAFHKAGSEVLAFPQPCVALLRTALDEILTLVE